MMRKIRIFTLAVLAASALAVNAFADVMSPGAYLVQTGALPALLVILVVVITALVVRKRKKK